MLSVDALPRAAPGVMVAPVIAGSERGALLDVIAGSRVAPSPPCGTLRSLAICWAYSILVTA
jgi:hypothetical protein